MQSTEGQPTQRASNNRLYGFDSLRAFATLLVVALHCGVPYVSSPMPGLVWPVQQHTAGLAVECLFWGTACCIMPLFFCMSGFFSHRLLNKLGSRKFVEHRRKRILVPLLIAAAVILPAEIYLWILGLVNEQRCSLRTLITLKFKEPENSLIWGLSHLWYLEYLLIYSLMYCWLQTKNWRPLARGAELFSQFRLLPVLLGGLSALVLIYEPQALIGFQHAFLPVASKFLFNGLFFMAGLALSHNRSMLVQWRQGSVRYLLMSAVIAPVLLIAIRAYVSGDNGFSLRLSLAVVAGLFASFSTCGLIGIFQYQQHPSHWSVRQMSESSYWVYLVHHPLTAVCHVGFAAWSLSAGSKFLLTFITTTICCRLTFHALVRYSWLGELLNGYRVSREKSILLPESVPLANTGLSHKPEVSLSPRKAAA